MDKNYSFFRHDKCEYFPCHETMEKEKFNCLFCYCPLYFIEDCKGNFKYIKGVKACTSCTIPHLEDGYDIIINEVKQQIKRKKITVNEVMNK